MYVKISGDVYGPYDQTDTFDEMVEDGHAKVYNRLSPAVIDALETGSSEAFIDLNERTCKEVLKELLDAPITEMAKEHVLKEREMIRHEKHTPTDVSPLDGDDYQEELSQFFDKNVNRDAFEVEGVVHVVENSFESHLDNLEYTIQKWWDAGYGENFVFEGNRLVEPDDEDEINKPSFLRELFN